MNDPTNPAGDEGVSDADVHEGVDQDGVDQDLDNDLDEGGEEGDLDGEDDQDEIEVDGVKHRIPKAVKPLVMFNADYTKKTQAVAARNSELDAREQSLSQQAETQKALLSHHTKVQGLREQLAAFEEFDWAAARRADPEGTQDLRDHVDKLKVNLGKAENELSEKEGEALKSQREARAKRLQEGHAVLVRDIKGWSPELAGKLSAFGQTVGYTAEEIRMWDDPRPWKLLHRAYQADQASKRQAAKERTDAAQGVRPTPRLTGSSGRFAAKPSTKDFAAFERLADGMTKG